MTSPEDPTGPGSPLLDTQAAAEALPMLEATLDRFAEARLVTPRRVDPDGSRWWDVEDLRRQLAAYLDDQP